MLNLCYIFVTLMLTKDKKVQYSNVIHSDTSRGDTRIQVLTNHLWETQQHWILSYTGNLAVYINLRRSFSSFRGTNTTLEYYQTPVNELGLLNKLSS